MLFYELIFTIMTVPWCSSK